MRKEIGRINIVSFFDFQRRPDPDAIEVDAMLAELESHIFPADKPVNPRSRTTIRRKFRKLMERLQELGEDWEGLA